MRGTVAKALRKSIYGDGGSHRQREYFKGHEPAAMVPNNRGGFWRNPTCICTGKRRAYQNAK